MKKRAQRILAAGLSLMMLIQPYTVYAEEEQTEIRIESQNTENDARETLVLESESEISEETSESNHDVYEAESDQEIVLEEELETEEVSEFVVDETDTEESETIEEDPIAIYASADDLVYGDFTYRVYGEGVTITGYTGTASELEIPNQINNLNVTRIAAYAFLNNQNLKKAVILKGIKEIGSEAFSGCSKLESIELPEGLETLGENFINNTMVSSLTIPRTVKQMNGSGGVIYSGGTLEEIIFADGMTEIPSYICRSDKKNTSLTKIVIPDSVTEIGMEAFENCAGLEEITFGKEIKRVGSWAFGGCSGLKSVRFQKNEKMVIDTDGKKKYYPVRIGSYAFSSCSNLEEIALTENVTEIGDSAFSGCSKLESIELPEGLETLGGNFINNTMVSSLTIPRTVKQMNGSGGVIYSGGALEEIIFADGMTEIPSYICRSDKKNTSLTKVVIPDSVTEIGTEAFCNCTSIAIYGYSGSYAETYAIENNIPFVSLGESISDCEYDYSEVLDRWLLDQGTSNSMRYLVNDENFTNSVTVAANDESFGVRVTEALANMIYRGMDGWKEILARETSRKQAREILFALMEIQEKEVKALAQVQTAKKYADLYIKTFKQANWAYAIDFGLNSKEIEQLAKVCKKDEITQFFLDGKYNRIEEYLQMTGKYKPDANVFKCIKSFEESDKWLKAYSQGSKWLGTGLTLLNTTQETCKKVYELECLQKTDEMYSEMLAYIRDHCSLLAVSQAADDLYGAIHGGYLEQTAYVSSAVANATEDFVIDQILDVASAAMPYGILVKGTFGLSAGLMNTVFHTGDAQKQADNMRCVAYIGKSLASWMTDCRLKYLTGKTSEKSDYARRTVYAYYMLLQTRMAGETSLQKMMELSKTNWKRAYNVSKEISATLESTETWLKNSGVLKNISTSVVACPVNVEIYDATGNLIMTLSDGSETEGYIGDIYYNVSYNPISNDYVKIVRTPVDGGYTLKCDAVDLGTVDYYLSVLDNNGVSVQQQVSNIPVEPGNTILIEDTSGNHTQCKLVDGDRTIKEYQTNQIPEEYVPVTMVQADNTDINMQPGEKKQVQITVLPANASIQDVKWTSSDASVAIVNEDGVVEAVGYGNATITAKAIKENVSAVISVAVPQSDNTKPEDTQKPDTNQGNQTNEQRSTETKLSPVLKLNATSVVLKTGQKTSGLKVIEMQKGDEVQSWKSDNTKIVKVTGTGKLIAQKKTGKTTVTVTLKSGLSKKITVKVQKKAVKTTKITGLKSKIRIGKGKQTVLKPILKPFTSTEKVKYSSSNKKIVSVTSKGKIKGIKPGKAKITVKAGKKKFVVTVTVTK